jgi:hypothetical protein
MQQILEYFDAQSEIGGIVGHGRGRSGPRRASVFRRMLFDAAAHLERGSRSAGCALLRACLLRSDGRGRPRDFVAGPAAAGLAERIAELREGLGCRAGPALAVGQRARQR